MDVPAAPSITRVLCVDLDGTLLATDVLWESLLVLLKTRPWKLVFLPLWLFKGKAYFKQQIARHVGLNPANLPYREDVLEFLRREKAAGRDIVLATGADRKFAEAVGQFVGLFSAIVASDGTTNLVGRRKLRALEIYAEGNGFDYLGNGKVDLLLWKAATEVMVVHPSARLLRQIQNGSVVQRIFSPREISLPNLWHALRVYQWVKNVLLFVPLLLAHKIFAVEQVLLLLYAFLSFSLCASSVYILNDLLDLEFDRHHPTKRLRPFAAGTLPISTGVILVPLLIGSSFLMAAFLLPPLFAAALALYLAMTTAYSFCLKRVVIFDVLVLAGLYTIRVLSGAIAVNVYVSPWLLAFSMFVFLSLALIKRYSELTMIHDSSETLAKGRGYYVDDRVFLLNVGIASGYLSLLVFTLYVNSQEVVALYQNAKSLWLVCPLFLYWITRIWFLAYRGLIVEDPLVFALKDPMSYIVGALIVLVIMIAL